MKTDVLIIGGGLAGCATAYFLAKEGVDVVLVERHDLNMRASGANAGSLHLQIPLAEFIELGEDWARAFAPTLPMMLKSVDLWMTLGDELGADLQAAKTGGLLVARSETQLAAVARKARIEAAHGIDMHMLGPSELKDIAPYISGTMIGAAYCPDEGKANPLLATNAFAAAAERLGARILPRRDVQSIEVEDRGFTVHLANETINAGRVVNAAGADAGRIGAMVGLDWPISGYPLQLSVTEPVDPIVSHLVYSADDKLTLKQMQNGTCIIGGGWPAIAKENGGTRVNPVSLTGNLRTAIAAVPGLSRTRIARSWSAIVNGTEDWRPVIGEVPRLPGFYLNLFPWMGFTAGPISALVTSEMILGREPSVDLKTVSALT